MSRHSVVGLETTHVGCNWTRFGPLYSGLPQRLMNITSKSLVYIVALNWLIDDVHLLNCYNKLITILFLAMWLSNKIRCLMQDRGPESSLKSDCSRFLDNLFYNCEFNCDSCFHISHCCVASTWFTTIKHHFAGVRFVLYYCYSFFEAFKWFLVEYRYGRKKGVWESVCIHYSFKTDNAVGILRIFSICNKCLVFHFLLTPLTCISLSRSKRR